MRSKSAGIGLVAAAIVVVGSVAWQAGANNAANNLPAPPRTAFVNLEKVINELEERSSMEADLQAFVSSRQEKINEIQANAKIAADEIEIMVPGNDAYRTKVEQLAMFKVQLDAEQNFAQQRIEVRQGEIMSHLFGKVQEAVTRIAEQEGYDVIFSNDFNIALQPGGNTGVMRQIAVRRLLYVNDSFDISDQVLQLMNNEWKAGAN